MFFALDSATDLNLSPKISAHSFRRGNETRKKVREDFDQTPDVWVQLKPIFLSKTKQNSIWNIFSALTLNNPQCYPNDYLHISLA